MRCVERAQTYDSSKSVYPCAGRAVLGVLLVSVQKLPSRKLRRSRRWIGARAPGDRRRALEPPLAQRANREVQRTRHIVYFGRIVPVGTPSQLFVLHCQEYAISVKQLQKITKWVYCTRAARDDISSELFVCSCRQIAYFRGCLNSRFTFVTISAKCVCYNGL